MFGEFTLPCSSDGLWHQTVLDDVAELEEESIVDDSHEVQSWRERFTHLENALWRSEVDGAGAVPVIS